MVTEIVKQLWISSFFLLLLVFCADAAENTKISTKNTKGDNLSGNMQWLKSNRARAVYGVDSASEVDTFANAGFNLIMPCGLNAVPGGYCSNPTAVINVAKRCKELGIKAMPYYWFTSEFFTYENYKDKGAEPPKVRDWYVLADGQKVYASCPIDETYWNHYLVEGLAETAKLSKEYPIVAIAIDFELYCTKTPGSYLEHCYCDHCWKRFCDLKGIDGKSIQAKDRYGYLKKIGQSEAYTSWQDGEVRKLAANLAKAVHKVNPDLALCYINYNRSNWFSYEAVRGLASDQAPAMAFGEIPTYGIGYGSVVDKLYDLLIKENALYYPGLWISFWQPIPILEDHAYQLGMHAGGWWVAPGCFLTSPAYKDFHQWDGKTEGGPHGPQESYLKLFSAANKRLAENQHIPQSKAPPMQNTFKAPSVDSFKTMSRVKIDGVLDEPAWTRAQKRELRLTNMDRAEPKGKTIIRFAWDNENLYLAAECMESNIKGLKRNCTRNDDLAICGDDSIEIFLDTAGHREQYFHLITNSAGAKYDENTGISIRTDLEWGCSWKTSAKVMKDRWVVEMAIPWTDINIKTLFKEKQILANVIRVSTVSGESSSWAPVVLQFHNPSFFGTINLAQSQSQER